MAKRTILLLVALMFLFSTAAWAGGGEPTTRELLDEIRALKTRLAELETKVASQAGKIDRAEKEVPVREKGKREKGKIENWIKYVPGEGVTIEPVGLRVKTGATYIVQGTPNANNAGTGEDSICDASWKIDIDIEKKFDDWGLAFLELEGGQGDTVNGELALFSIVNNNANDTNSRVIVNKFWYEHYLLDKQFTLTCGKLDPTDYFDQNEYAGDDSYQFLGAIFNNTHAIEWPSANAFGIRGNLCFEPIDFLDFDLGYLEGNADWEDIFEHGVFMGQVNLKPASILEIDPGQWAGNYRFECWVNGRDHTKLLERDKNKEVNYGFGLSCDQMVTDVFGVFGRFNWQRPDLIPADGGATIEWSWSTGAQMTGKYWKREEDILAIAVGQDFPSEEYKDAGNPGSAEGHFEAYYRCQLNDYLAISPDFQLIWDPNGVGKPADGDDGTIFVYGARARLTF